MSFHYEVVLSLFLRDDTPTEVLDELRWHLGLCEQPPAVSAIDADYPVMRPGDVSYLPGGDVATLQRQYRITDRFGVERYAWGLYARRFVLDDDLADSLQILTWLAPFADEDGYAGFLREEADEHPDLLLVRGGEPHIDRHGTQPDP